MKTQSLSKYVFLMGFWILKCVFEIDLQTTSYRRLNKFLNVIRKFEGVNHGIQNVDTVIICFLIF